MNNVISKIRSILDDSENRQELVKKFQEDVWAGNYSENNSLNDILKALAYDLDYYEQDPLLRKEGGYYGDDRLKEEIEDAIAKISSCQ